MPVTIATEPATALAMPAMSSTLREELECGEVEGEGEGEGELKADG